MAIAKKLAVAGALAAFAFLGWTIVRVQRPPEAVTARTPQQEEHRKDVTARWESLEYLELPTVSDHVLEEKLGQLLGSLENLSEHQRRKLREVLRDQLAARAAQTPRAYLELADSDPTTRWITSDDEWAWSRAKDWYERFDGTLAPATVASALRRFIEIEYQDGGRVTGVAAVPEGVRTRSFQVRSADQVDYELVSGLTREESSYWFENEGHLGVQFRLPKRSLHELLAARGGALVVDVALLVRSEKGPYNLHTTWFWDPSFGGWVCHRLARKGWHGYVWF